MPRELNLSPEIARPLSPGLKQWPGRFSADADYHEEVKKLCKRWGSSLYATLGVPSGRDLPEGWTRQVLLDWIGRERVAPTPIDPESMRVSMAARSMRPDQCVVLYVHYVLPWNAKGDERHEAKWRMLYVGSSRYFSTLDSALSHLHGALSVRELLAP